MRCKCWTIGKYSRAFHSFQVSRVSRSATGCVISRRLLPTTCCRHFPRIITPFLPYFEYVRLRIVARGHFFLEVFFFHIITLDGLSKREATRSLWVRFLPHCTFVVDVGGTSDSFDLVFVICSQYEPWIDKIRRIHWLSALKTAISCKDSH